LSTARPVQTVDPNRQSVGNNKMLLTAQSRSGRSASPWIDHDTHQNVTRDGRRKVMVKGRWLAQNFPSLTGAILEQSDMACGTWVPEFQGEDKDWGERATEWLLEWEKIMDVTGTLDGDGYRDQLLASTLIDGELGTILTETPSKHPRIQTLRSHRIGSMQEKSLATDKHKVVDGVLVNRFNRPYQYVVQPDNHAAPITIHAKNFILSYDPLPGCPDQLRGISWLGSSADDWEDLDESKRFELAAQKACSVHSLIEHNEDGEMDPLKQRFNMSQTNDDSTNALETTARIEVEDQYIVYRADSNSRLEAFNYDRPGQNVQQYQAMVETHGFRGIGWSRFFSVDPSKLGGASMRVEVDRLVRTLRRRQRLISRTMKRIHTYALAKAINLGLLPMNDEFWKWTYQKPDIPTADRKYESDIAVQENNAGFITLDKIAGRRGERWQDVQDQRLTEVKRQIERAKEVLGVDLDPVPLLFPEHTTIENRPVTGPVNQNDDE